MTAAATAEPIIATGVVRRLVDLATDEDLDPFARRALGHVFFSDDVAPEDIDAAALPDLFRVVLDCRIGKSSAAEVERAACTVLRVVALPVP